MGARPNHVIIYACLTTFLNVCCIRCIMRILPSLFVAKMSSSHLTHLRALPASGTCLPPAPACLQYLPASDICRLLAACQRAYYHLHQLTNAHPPIQLFNNTRTACILFALSSAIFHSLSASY
jgi:hypothetical protein